jgi:tRNA threonylcarbamoyladenosine biosynthesis protein TsaB
MTRILALDGALARCSVALLDGEAMLAAEGEDTARGHAAILPAMVQRVLARAGIAATTLDAVAVGVGPGGFTGLRAAIALGQGLALGAGCPILGVTSGEALVAALVDDMARDRPVWSVLDNRRGAVFAEFFAPGAAVPDGPPAVLDLGALPWDAAPPLVVGDATAAVLAEAARRGVPAMAGGPVLPDAVGVAHLAARRLAGQVPGRDAKPLYVEPPSVRPPA